MQLLKEFPVVITLPVAWGEMDALQHVNNIVYFRYFESARMAYFQRLAWLEDMESSGVGPILSTTSCRFLMPLAYPDDVAVGARVSMLSSDRFVMQFSVVSQSHNRLAALGDGLIVAYNYHERKRAELPAVIRDRILSLEIVTPDLK